MESKVAQQSVSFNVLTYEPPIGQSPPNRLFFKHRYFRASVFLITCLLSSLVTQIFFEYTTLRRFLCVGEDPEVRLCALFGILQFFVFIGLAICGFSFDILGPWITGLVGCILFLTGWIGHMILSLQSISTTLFFVSTFFIVFPCFSLGDLFPKYRGLAISLVVASQTTGIVVAPLLLGSSNDITYEYDVFMCFAIAFIPVMIAYLLCVPWSRWAINSNSTNPLSLSDDSAASRDIWFSKHPDFVESSGNAIDIENLDNPKNAASGNWLTEFWIFTAYHTLQLLQDGYFPKVVSAVGEKISIFQGHILITEGAFGTLFGLAVDKTKTLPICVGLISMVRLIVNPPLFYFFLQMTFAYGLALIEYTNVQYLTSILYVISHSYIHTAKYTYIAEIFPPKKFGRFAGLVGSVSGSLALANIAILSHSVFILLAYIAVGGISLLLVLFLWERQLKGIHYRRNR